MPWESGIWINADIVHPKREHVAIAKSQRECKRHGSFDSTKWELQPTTPVTPAFWSQCPKCDMEIQQEQEAAHSQEARDLAMRIALTRYGIPGRFIDSTLDNFSALLPGQKNVLKWARDFAYHFDLAMATGRSAMFLGTAGTGKTRLACAIARHIHHRGVAICYTTAPDLMARVKATYSQRSEESTEMVVRDLSEVDFLILDEVGRQLDTDHDKAHLFRVLNNRYEEKKPTLVVSNLSKTEIGDCLGAAVVDRLRENGGAALIFNWASQRGEP